MKKELIIDKHGLGNAVVVLDHKKIVDYSSILHPIQTFIPQILLLKHKYRGDYLKRRLFRKAAKWKSGVSQIKHLL